MTDSVVSIKCIKVEMEEAFMKTSTNHSFNRADRVALPYTELMVNTVVCTEVGMEEALMKPITNHSPNRKDRVLFKIQSRRRKQTFHWS